MARFLRLRLNQWRNYSELDLSSDAQLIVLFGENGAGKTNLLEALSLFGPGRGLRRAHAEDATRHGSLHGFAVAADVDGALGAARLGIGSEASESGHERKLRIDGASINATTAFADHVRLLWLVPDQDDLFRGAAGERRRYLDRLVLAVHPEHGTTVSRFERLMRERNKLLEESHPDPIWLSAIEKEAAEAAIAVAAARAETASRLQAIMERLQKDLPESLFPAAGLQLDGVLEARVPREPASDIEAWYRDTLKTQRPIDRAAGRALIGPQASDLLVTHRAKSMPASLCSTGEQKALLIGLIMAQAALVGDMTGMRPVLLLDEVAAHLDQKRRASLFERLQALGSQVFMTGTDRALFADAPHDTLHVHVAAGQAKKE